MKRTALGRQQKDLQFESQQLLISCRRERVFELLIIIRVCSTNFEVMP